MTLFVKQGIAKYASFRVKLMLVSVTTIKLLKINNFSANK